MTEEHHQPALGAHDSIKGGFSHLQFKPDDYRYHLEGLELSPQQQDELLHIVFDIMRQFVDWGFNLHPVQTAQSDGKCSIDVVALIEHWAEASREEETE